MLSCINCVGSANLLHTCRSMCNASFNAQFFKAIANVNRACSQLMLSILASNCAAKFDFCTPLNSGKTHQGPIVRRNSLAKLEQFSGFTSAMHKPPLVLFEYHTEHSCAATNRRQSSSLNDDGMCAQVSQL